MKLTDIETIKSIMRDNNLWAKKKFGQNFLVDENVLGKIIKSSDLKNDDTVLEVGPGLGVLTSELSKYAKLILSVEKDQSMVDFLRREFKSHENIKIIHADILIYDIKSIEGKYKIVANIPYNITSVLIRKCLESNSSKNLESMTLMVQKEVAERICAKPGTSDRGMLTVMVEFYSNAEIIDIVKKDSFWPVPDVDSAIIKIVPREDNLLGKGADPSGFFRIVKIGFSQKRRQIHHPFSASLKLSKNEISNIFKLADIEPSLRAEDLSMNDWIRLYKLINSKFSS